MAERIRISSGNLKRNCRSNNPSWATQRFFQYSSLNSFCDTITSATHLSCWRRAARYTWRVKLSSQNYLKMRPSNVIYVLLVCVTCVLASEKKKVDYYKYRHLVAEGVQLALDECRDKFKWDRWNCPKKAFLDILDQNAQPANKEIGLTHALIASGIVLSLARSCTYGSENICGCNLTASLAARASGVAGSIDGLSGQTMVYKSPDTNNSREFVWQGCDEIVKFAFRISKLYLDSQEIRQHPVTKRINSHNYEAGRLAVKRTMRKTCKCHGISGSCQMNTCWNSLPSMSEIGGYLQNQYRIAAKVGAMSSKETDLHNLNGELEKLRREKLAFVDASPDYCYPNPELGVNGTLDRLCSRATSKGGRESCNNLCTKCGYRIKKELVTVVTQCNCRFVFCCDVECTQCSNVETTYRCARHS